MHALIVITCVTVILNVLSKPIGQWRARKRAEYSFRPAAGVERLK